MIDLYDKFIVAFEDKDKFGDPAEPHYHIYIETEYIDDTVRGHFMRNLNIPKVKRGQGNKYSMLKPWEGIDYICKYGDIRVSKGFTEEELEKAEIDGKKYLKNKPINTDILDAYADGVAAGKAKGKTTYKNPSKDAEIIASLTEWYYGYKTENDGDAPPLKLLIERACFYTRQHHKGINIFKVRDYVHTVMYEGDDYKKTIIDKIYSIA